MKLFKSVNISRIGHLQNGYYFGLMNHNTIWQNSMSKVNYRSDNLTLFKMDLHSDFVQLFE
jgi:hypothetical protein